MTTEDHYIAHRRHSQPLVEALVYLDILNMLLSLLNVDLGHKPPRETGLKNEFKL